MPVIAVPLVLSTLGAGVPDRPDDVDARVIEAKYGLLDEIDLLAELEVFSPDPIVQRIRDQIPTDEQGRGELIPVLDDVDEDNVDRLDDLFDAGLFLSDEVVAALDPLPDDVIDRIDEGDTGFLDPAPWLDGLTDLILRDGDVSFADDPSERQAILDLLDLMAGADDGGRPSPATREPAGAPAPVVDDPRPPVEGEVDASEPDPVDAVTPVVVDPVDDAAGSTGPSAPILAGAGGLLLLVVAALLFRSRRPSPLAPTAMAPAGPSRPPAAGRLDDLLDTSRRMTSALDGSEVQRIAVRDGMRLTQAEAGAFLAAGGDARFTEALPAHFFTDAPVTEGLLARVLETGQSTSATTDDEPSLAQLPMALAAVPVIADGGVVGALVMLRSPSEPFGTTEVDTLAHLAPIVGSALSAAEEHRSAVTDAERDGLTTLLNRRRLDRDLSAVEGVPMAFAMIDVDHFKRFNDVHGHQGGDDALRTVAAVLAETVRTTDVVYRYGGEEFSVLLRGTTSEEAHEVLERVREAVESTEIVASDGRSLGHVTFSVGVVATTTEQEPSASLPNRADRARYDAKSEGRNRVVIGS